MPNYSLSEMWTRKAKAIKNHRNVAHTQHCHKVAEILNTNFLMQLYYCIKKNKKRKRRSRNPKTRQKYTNTTTKKAKADEALLSIWRSHATYVCCCCCSSPDICLPAHVWYVRKRKCVCMTVAVCQYVCERVRVCFVITHCLCTLCERAAKKLALTLPLLLAVATAAAIVIVIVVLVLVLVAILAALTVAHK